HHPRRRVPSPTPRSRVHRLSGHDRRPPAGGDRAPPSRRATDRDPPARAPGRVGDRLLEGTAAARLGAEPILARLSRRRRAPQAGGDGAVVRRSLGSHGPEVTTVGLGSWAMSGPYVFGWGPADDDESIAAIR